MLHFYTPWKHPETSGFPMFLGGIEVRHWSKIVKYVPFNENPNNWLEIKERFTEQNPHTRKISQKLVLLECLCEYKSSVSSPKIRQVINLFSASGFLMFSKGIEVEHWLKMGWCWKIWT